MRLRDKYPPEIADKRGLKDEAEALNSREETYLTSEKLP